MQVGKFPKLIKRAGWNKAVQDGIFQKSIVKKTCRLEKFLKLIKLAGCNKAVQVAFFQKLIKRAACLLDRLEYIVKFIKVSSSLGIF